MFPTLQSRARARTGFDCAPSAGDDLDVHGRASSSGVAGHVLGSFAAMLVTGAAYAQPTMGVPSPTAPSDGALVDIKTTDPRTTLERRVGSFWERVCVAPCRTPVALAGEYRIGGDGVVPSNGFSIHGPRTVLEVDPGSEGLHSLGAYMTVFGFVLAA